MTYPPANIWWQVQIDPKPEVEPELIEVTTPNLAARLFLPVTWIPERRQAWLEWWKS